MLAVLREGHGEGIQEVEQERGKHHRLRNHLHGLFSQHRQGMKHVLRFQTAWRLQYHHFDTSRFEEAGHI